MASRFSNGQKVGIKESRNADGTLRYPKTEKYIHETGTIVKCERIATIKDVPGYEEHMPIEVYCYTVRFNKHDVEVELGEDALVALDE